MAKTLDTVILMALPASGKSEVRKYLAGLDAKTCRDEFHLGETVQLDDFPYVHLMRRVDDELARLGERRIFFHAGDRPFQNGFEWGTLIELVNEDYARLVSRTKLEAASFGRLLLDRFDRARAMVGGGRALGLLAPKARDALSAALEKEARELHEGLNETVPATLEGKTVVIEFARGGAQGSPMPLPAPYGYMYSLGRLSPEILERAAILYIWVTPEESRRKNHERTDPNDPGSILHHGVPMEVMLKEYGTDDVEYLLRTSGKADTVTIEAHGRKYALPLARLDNRVDKTSFIRKPKDQWKPAEVAAIHGGLEDALSRLAALK